MANLAIHLLTVLLRTWVIRLSEVCGEDVGLATRLTPIVEEIEDIARRLEHLE